MLRTPKRQTGFTLVELMISIGLLSVLLVLISQLFGQTSSAVSTSIRSSHILAVARSTGTQMDNDFKNMLGPKGNIADPNGGYIIIINHRINNGGNGIAFPYSRNGAEYRQNFTRSDQIVFVRNGVGINSMTPLNAGGYGSPLAAENTPVLVRYGHAQRTNRNGTPRTGANTALGQNNAGLDRLATEFILGRSQLLMNPPGLDTNLHTHARSYRFDAVVNLSGFGAGARQYLGHTDVTASPYVAPANGVSPALRPALNNGTQNDRNLSYLLTSFTYARMQVNPAPTGTDYQSWAVAQTHGILAPNCSEFIVQFAADLNGNGRVDTTDTSGNDIGGAIRWYDGFNTNFDGTGTPPTVTWQQPAPADGTPVDANYPYQPYTAPAQIAGGLPASANATNVFIFRDRDATARATPAPTTGASTPEPSSNWPYMIRIRYRLHDARGKVTSNDPWAKTDLIDNDGDGVVDNVEEEAISGRWFEHIYRVPRPGVTP